MRQERTVQGSIFDVFAGHEIGRELKAMSEWLDAHRALLVRVSEDLRRDDVRATGRQGLPAEAVLRCALLKQYRQLSYEELAFHLEDSASFRAFARLPWAWSPRKSVLQKTISAIRAETWETINRTLLANAKAEKLEDGRVVRLDSTVTAVLMHEPSDSSLLWDAVRVMVRLLQEADTLLGGPGPGWRDHRRAAKKRWRAIEFTRGRPQRVQLYRELIQLTARPSRSAIFAAHGRPQGEGARMPVRLRQIETPEPLAIDYRPVASLIPYVRNARTHSEAQVVLIAGSIREYGFTNPVLVDGASGIIAGHGRVLAARKLGLASVPVIELAHLSEAQKRAYVLADNRLAEAAGWDRELLALEAGDLSDMGVDLASLGFEAAEIDALLNAGAPDPREEATPEPPAAPVSPPGDLWLLGRHRLFCGSSTEPADVARLLGGVRPHLLVSDPPYGVHYDPGWRNRAGASNTQRTGNVLNDDRADWREAWALFPGEVAYVWHGALHATTVADSLVACGFAIRSQIIWAKERLVLSRGDYHWQHEPCWYAVREKGRGHWTGDRKQSTLWSIPSRDQDATTVHGTQKPVEAMRRPMINNSAPGQPVYEPFSGSGTSIIAAETCGRISLSMELDPRYVDVAVTRWQDFIGESAVLDGDGRGFAAIAAERAS